ncbi:hypothetical protein GUJ93_ZPchr0010g10706 [Zizania palustris]|uniref:Uncharacterized protein n=1 Tax=Zizania palustris TaxID=103762 RepID=A0A8J5WGT1_ZIZPA|nr:hypothetical protein GUJ93_ZPchr0010g10706 [Zizania palustris]
MLPLVPVEPVEPIPDPNIDDRSRGIDDVNAGEQFRLPDDAEKIQKNPARTMKNVVPTMALHQSARIKRDGVPISENAKQRVDLKNDISVEESLEESGPRKKKSKP